MHNGAKYIIILEAEFWVTKNRQFYIMFRNNFLATQPSVFQRASLCIIKFSSTTTFLFFLSWPTLSAIYTLANFCFLSILFSKRVLHLCKLLFFKVVIIFNNNNFFLFFKTFIFCQTTTSYVRIIIIPLQKGFHEIALSNCNFALCTAFTNEVKIAVTSFNICCSWVYSLSNVILWCAFASFGDHDAKSKRGYTILAIAYRYSRSLNSAEKYPKSHYASAK